MMAENDSSSRLRNLRRHPAFQAAAIYVGASWAIIEGADILLPSFGQSPAVVRLLALVLAVGFVIVVGYVWRAAVAEARATATSAEAEKAEAEVGAPMRRRRRRLAYAASIALLLLGGFFWWARPHILGAVAPAAEVIAVMPFHTSGSGVELLGEGMVDLLSPNLDVVGAIRTVDSRTVLHRWHQRASDGSLDLQGALAVGRDVDAGSILWGTATAVGPEVRLTAQLYTVKGVELASVRAEGPVDSVLALVDSLSVNLLKRIWVSREPVPNLRVSAITTGSIDAIRSYLKGEQHYRRSQWDSALVAFQAAVDEDSTFALAQYRLALSHGWTTGFGSSGAVRHGEAAYRWSHRLPDREKSVVAAHVLFEEGRMDALDTLESYVARYPDDVEAWYLLGDVQYHARPLLDLTPTQYYEPFDRVIELDPSLAPAIIHPIEFGLLFNDSIAYERYIRALRDASPSIVEPYELAATVLFGEGAAADSARIAVASTEPTLLSVIYTAALESSASSDSVIAMYERDVQIALEAGSLPPAFATPGNIQLSTASALAGLGRLAEAKPLYDSLWASGSPFAGAGLMPVLAGLADSTYAPGPLAFLAAPKSDPAFQLIVDVQRMAFALSQGDAGTARDIAVAGLAADSAVTTDFSAGLFTAGLGWADIMEGDTASGVTKMRSGLRQAGYDFQALLMGQPFRFQLTATLAGRPETRDEAIRRLRYGAWFTDILSTALRFFVLGQALEASGDLPAAVRAYSQFVHLWDKADPHLQPQVETARRALERLGREESM